MCLGQYRADKRVLVAWLEVSGFEPKLRIVHAFMFRQ